MNKALNLLCSLLLLAWTQSTQAQVSSAADTITHSFCMDEDLSTWLATEQPYGTQGVFDKNYGRIQMHFATIQHDAANPCKYLVTGASRHMGTVTPFVGWIEIGEVRVLDQRGSSAEPGALDLGVTGTYVLREDSTQKYSGIFQGKLNFRLHRFPDNTLLDDQLARMGPIYRNFTYQGTYQFYTSRRGPGVQASWSRGRLPVPDGLDVGKDRFQISPKYEKNGWQRDSTGKYVDDVPKWWEGGSK